jgi:hypothetical protein
MPRPEVDRITGEGISPALRPHFDLDFNTAFAPGPAKPHGVAMK